MDYRKVLCMICFDNVSFKYAKDSESLKNINLTVNEGEVVLICGPSGCGKSTLVRCVNGLIPHFYQGENDRHSYGQRNRCISDYA